MIVDGGSVACRTCFVDKVYPRFRWVGPKGLVIKYGEGGLQNGKTMSPKLYAHPPPPPPPSRQVKTVCPPPPLLKGGNFLHPPQYG